MVKHIKKSYSKDGKLTDREKSIAYATAWKHHNEENDLTELKTDTIANYTQGAQISLKKDSSKENVKKRIKGLARAGSQLGKRVWDGKLKEEHPLTKLGYKDVTKKRKGEGYGKGLEDARRKMANQKKVNQVDMVGRSSKVNEDARYDSSIGGHEWGTPEGTDYFKSLTPGQSNPKEDPIKPLAIKARKPEDEKAVKVTEAYPVYKTPEYHKRMKAKDAKLRKYREGLAKKAQAKIKRTHTTSESLIAQFEPEYSEAKRRLGNKIRGKLGVKKKPELDWKKDRGIKEDFDLSHIEPNQADHTKHQYPIDNAVNAEWEANLDGILTGAYEGGEITWEDVKALDKDAENFSFDDALDLGLYDDEELAREDFDEDPYNDTEITEVLSVQGRMKRRFAARRNRQKLKVARRIALRRGSTPDRLKRRATRGARLMVYKRLLRGRDRAGLPPAEKARLEKMITRFAPLVQRISVKLLPQMRKNEIKRLTQRGKMRPQTSKKYKAAKPVRSASSQKAKRYKIKAGGKYKMPKPKKPVSRIKSGGPTLKKASKAYKAFSYSVG